MSMRELTNVCNGVRHVVTSLALTGTLLTWASGPAAPAQADHEPEHQPTTRLEIVIKKIFIFDDRDGWSGGDGDMKFTLNFYQAIEKDGCTGLFYDDGCGVELVRSAPIEFDASTGEWVDINRTVPGPGGFVADASIGPGIGIPVYAGDSYGFQIHGVDKDLLIDDNLGYLNVNLSESNGWRIGTYTRERGYVSVADLTGWDIYPSYFDVDYEIRQVPLPDLVAHNLTPFTASNGREAVRMIMQNVGERDAGPFQYALRADGAVSPLATYDFPGLAAGATADAFYFPTDLSAGEHRFTFTIDDPRQIAEMDETNNQIAERIALQPATAAGPQALAGPDQARPGPDGPAASPAQADLTVSAIRVNGEPASEDSCDPGKNDVAVIVKNLGAGAAANFALRLVIDDEADEAKEKTVASLAGNQELSVTFDDLRLKKGEHKLTATVDARTTVGESKEDNNELKATLKCKHDD